MRIYGTYEGYLTFIDAELFVGEKDGIFHVEITYPTEGICHDKAENAICEGDSLTFQLGINESVADITAELKDGSLEGSFDWEEGNIHGKFTLHKKSDDFVFGETKLIVPETSRKLLMENHTFTNEEKIIDFEYEFGNKEVLAFLKKEGIETENHHDLETVRELLKQLSAVLSHDGMGHHHAKGFGTIEQFVYAKEHDSCTNCRGMAMIFSGIMRAYGFRSSYVELVPKEGQDEMIHVVCDVYVPEWKKYILVDPTVGAIYYRDGKPLSLMELRNVLAENKWESLTMDNFGQRKTDLLGAVGFTVRYLMKFIKCIKNTEALGMENNCILLRPVELNGEMVTRNAIVTNNPDVFFSAE